jgi:RNA-dependent RNA polymerase
MGVIDETGILNEDEVFIQCSIDNIINSNFKFYEEIVKSNRNSFIVTAKVVVAKNPCMHAGDVRVLKAVNIPELEHMINCIVFPRRGNRPITNQCSGSDLDGDLYFVTWEPSLIPKQVCNALDYTSQSAKEKHEISIEDVIKFFVKFIEVDQLGRIANAHVAISDSSHLGVKDPVCVELALAFSLAVDFPKTGIVPKIPDAAKNILSYPDFMEKNFNSYESQKVIGTCFN